MGFKRIGRVKGCGNLRSHPNELIDAIIYGRDLGPEGEDFVSEERFDKIRFYLKHGKYPNGADRAEKSRLRSAATHYKLLPAEDGSENERLMLKDKEVVADPQRQYEIARQVHAQAHGGINKTTATIAEKFHWVRIKETVSLVIKNCPDCKEIGKAPPSRLEGSSTGRRSNNGATATQDPNSAIVRLVNFEEPSVPRPTQSSNRTSPGSRSPHDQPPIRAPVAHMGSYDDMPLDPQIMENVHHRLPTYPDHEQGKEGFAIDMEHEQQMIDQQMVEETRLATEGHVRRGNEPIGFQVEEESVDGLGEVDRGDVGDVDGEVGMEVEYGGVPV